MNWQVLYDVFYKNASGNDIGMYANMNVIKNCNAKTPNVLDSFNHCKNYTNLETDALITAATLEYFGVESLKDATFIPPDILNGSRQVRRIWLHSHIKAMLLKFVMSGQDTT